MRALNRLFGNLRSIVADNPLIKATVSGITTISSKAHSLAQQANSMRRALFINMLSPRTFTSFEKINFLVNELCPADLPNEDYLSWVEAYLAKLPANALIFWRLQNKQLNISFKNNEQIITHLTLAKFIVNDELQVIKNNIPLTTTELLEKAAKKLRKPLPRSFTIPLLEVLQEHSEAIYLDKKVVTKKILDKAKMQAERLEDNLNSHLECSICFENYNKQNPPALIRKSGNIYHNDCLKKHWQSCLEMGRPFFDPLTRIDVSSGFHLEDAIAPATFHSRLSDEGRELIKQLKHWQHLAEILFEKNQELTLENQRIRLETSGASTSTLQEYHLSQERASDKELEQTIVTEMDCHERIAPSQL